MQKLLIASALALALTLGVNVNAETLTGKVIKTEGNTVTIQQKDGTKSTLKTTDNTTYRKKKMSKRDKKADKRISKNSAWYVPLIEEDDWVEVVYTPGNNNDWYIEDVTVYDD